MQIVPQGLKNIYHLLESYIASIFYSSPSKKLKIIGVTGTDGKTTTVNLIYYLLKNALFKVSMVSSVNAVIGNREYETGFHITTPNPFDLQKYLARMVEAGSEFSVIEVTSHALDQNRTEGINFLAGVLTNVTHEHLDYHKNFESYLKTKVKLFKRVEFSVLNKDDPSFSRINQHSSGKIVTYSIKEKADFIAKNIEYSAKESSFDVLYDETVLALKTSLIGQFNIYNCLAAISLVKSLGVSESVISESLPLFPGVPGRMEKLKTNTDYHIVIDFAHTPNSLEQTLLSVRSFTKGRIIVCFGAAAERDTAKRPIMGRIAIRLADLIVLTNEDPRFEDPNKILTDIAKGVVKAGGVLNKDFWMIEDRAKAIKFALDLAKPRDIVLLLGKGHEKSISIKGKEYPWSDKEAVFRALRR